MALPGLSEVNAAAQRFGADPLLMFAYARRHNAVPTSQADVDTFSAKVISQAQGLGVSNDLVEGYLQEKGAWPANKAYLVSWAQGRNFVDANGNEINQPQPGENYPGNPAPAPTTTSTTPSTTSGFSLGGIISWAQSNPLLAAGGAGAVLLGLALVGGGGRRR